MKSLYILILIGSITRSLRADPEVPVKKEPDLHQRMSEAQASTLNKFFIGGASLCFLGTYAMLYTQAHRSHSPISHTKLLINSLGYTGAGFSIAAASYFAALLWSKSGLFQDKATKKASR